MNDRKCAFIICSNDDFYYEESVAYIRHLNVPANYEVEVLKIENAVSMAAGYNEGMLKTDAKYKIYMHHDVYIYNRDFIRDIIEIFEADKTIGLLGVVGGSDLPKDATIWDSWNLGGTYGTDNYRVQKINFYQNPEIPVMEADAIDGMLMVTQYDLPWREDIFDGWDFYDISQSMEFRRKGYKVVIPYQTDYWCMHDCGHSKLINYDKYREKFLDEYKEYSGAEFVPKVQPEIWKIQEQIFERLKSVFNAGDYKSVFLMIEGMQDTYISDNNLRYAQNFYDIYQRELGIQTLGFFEDVTDWEHAKRKYERIKFVLWDIERNHNNRRVEAFISQIREKKISSQAIAAISIHVNVDCKETLTKLKEILLK